MPTLYYKKGSCNEPCIALVAQVDNYIYTGTYKSIKEFEKFLHEEYDVLELNHTNFEVFGCEVAQANDGSITLTQSEKYKQILDGVLTVDPNCSGNELVTPNELTSYKSLIGKMLFIGRLFHPAMLRIAPQMAINTFKLLLLQLKDLNALVKYASKYHTTVRFKLPESSLRLMLKVIVEALMGSKKGPNAREGYLMVRRVSDAIHTVFGHSRKLRRVALPLLLYVNGSTLHRTVDLFGVSIKTSEEK